MEPFRIYNLLHLGIDSAVSNLWSIAAALAAVGIFSMAVIEILKLILQPRYFLNKAIFKRWLRKNKYEGVEQEILKLSTGGSEFLLYNLPIERMAGQINAAAQIALAYPSKYPKIIRALSVNADSDDQDTIIINYQKNDENDDLQKYSDARNRISNMIQRNLDALQIQLDGYWARGQQIAAVLISILLILYLLFPMAADAEDGAKLICFAVFGGIVAPVAKNILSILKSVKERSR